MHQESRFLDAKFVEYIKWNREFACLLEYLNWVLHTAVVNVDGFGGVERYKQTKRQEK